VQDDPGFSQLTPRLLSALETICDKLLSILAFNFNLRHYILGEESVPPGMEASAAALAELLSPGGAEWLWVVDPIDGTTNFVHGMPLSAISIGVAYRGEVVVAVIMDPFAGEIFSAVKGGGREGAARGPYPCPIPSPPPFSASLEPRRVPVRVTLCNSL